MNSEVISNEKIELQTEILMLSSKLSTVKSKTDFDKLSGEVKTLLKKIVQSGITGINTDALEAAVQEAKDISKKNDKTARELSGQTDSVTLGDSNKPTDKSITGFSEVKRDTNKSIKKLNKENKKLNKLIDSWDKGKKPDANDLLGFIKSEKEIKEEQERRKKLLQEKKRLDEKHARLQNKINSLQEGLKSGNFLEKEVKQKTNELEALKNTFAKVSKKKLNVDKLVKKEEKARKNRKSIITRLEKHVKENQKDKKLGEIVGILKDQYQSIETGEPSKMKKERKEVLSAKAKAAQRRKKLRKKKQKNNIFAKLKKKASASRKIKNQSKINPPSSSPSLKNSGREKGSGGHSI